MTEFSTVTTKGQLVIPSKLRRKLGIRKGTQVIFIEEDGKLMIQPLTREFLRGLRGSLQGKPSLLDLLLDDRKKERKL